jgi:hypothetical protein
MLFLLFTPFPDKFSPGRRQWNGERKGSYQLLGLLKYKPSFLWISGEKWNKFAGIKKFMTKNKVIIIMV